MWTARVMRGISLLGAAAVLFSCATVSTPAQRGEEPEFRVRATRPAIPVVGAPYTATLLNHLEADMWRVDASASLRAYRDAWKGWDRASVYFTHLDASYWVYRRCSYTAATVERMIRCMQQVLPAQDHHVIRQAIEDYDVQHRRRWPAVEARLNAVAMELTGRLSQPEAHRAFIQLSRLAHLRSTRWTDLLRIIVVEGNSASTWGHREAEFLIVQVDRSTDGDRSLGRVFHESAHYAARVSPMRSDVERACAAYGHAGLVACNHWDDVFATSFERVAMTELGARRPLIPHHDPRIQALSTALFRRALAEGMPPVGDELANVIVHLSRSEWPRQRWRMKDYMWRVAVYSEDAVARAPFAHRDRIGLGATGAGVPDQLGALRELGPGGLTLLLVTADTLNDRPRLLHDLGLAPDELPEAAWQRPMLYRVDYQDGFPVLVVTAPTVQQLRLAAQILRERADQDPLPAPGWHRL